MKQKNKYDLTGYHLGILSEDQATEIEAALTQNPDLERKSQQIKSRQQSIKGEIKRAVDGLLPSPVLSFNQISNVINSPQAKRLKLIWFQPILHLIPAIIGVALILFGIHQSAIITRLIRPEYFSEPLEMTILVPILSMLLMLVSPMVTGQTQKTIWGKSAPAILLTTLLWLGQTLLWLFMAYYLQEFVGKVVFLMTENIDAAIFSKTLALFLLSIAWLSGTIISGEYHYKYWGQPQSWRAFGRIFVISGIVLTSVYLLLQL
jgi:hypothetical protein